MNICHDITCSSSNDCLGTSRRVFLEQNLCSALQTGLRRVRFWHPPPNWSAKDWEEEIVDIGSAAAFEAVSEFDASRSIPVEAFVYYRVLARVLTCYRREWSFSSRFQAPSMRREDNADTGFEASAFDAAADSEPADYLDLREALTALPEPRRQVIIRIFWDGRSEKEIAVQLGISQRAVSKRKIAGLKQLRTRLPRSSD